MSNYYDLVDSEEGVGRRLDYDLGACCNYNDVGNGFRLEDVAYVLGRVDGENDGPSYWWLCAMKDHTYAVVHGSCDYTGWDCQSSGEASIYPTLREAITLLPEVEEYSDRRIKESIEKQLVGELAFGEVKS